MGKIYAEELLEWKLTVDRRRQSNRTFEARIPRNVRPRYVLGGVPRPRGYVISQIFTKKSRLFGCCSELSTGHRSSHAGNQSSEESTLVESNTVGKMDSN
jgi:hypothetical protein